MKEKKKENGVISVTLKANAVNKLRHLLILQQPLHKHVLKEDGFQEMDVDTTVFPLMTKIQPDFIGDQPIMSSN